MGAAFAWDGAALGAPVGTGRQRRLVVVRPSGPTPSGAVAEVPPTPARDRARTASAPTPTLARRRIGPADGTRTGHVRVTRSGRLALTAIVALALAAAALLAAVTLGGPSAAATPHTITVQRGQTLSELAVTYLPNLTIADGVEAIRRVNHLQNDWIIAGDPLVIPEP